MRLLVAVVGVALAMSVAGLSSAWAETAKPALGATMPRAPEAAAARRGPVPACHSRSSVLAAQIRVALGSTDSNDFAGETLCPARSAHAHALGSCSTADLTATVAVHLAAVTQENPILITLRNRTDSACALRGYPAPTLFNGRGGALPFAVARTGDRQVTSHRPVLVPMAPGARAFVLLGTTSCENRRPTEAPTLDLRLPGGSGRFRLRLRAPTSFCGRGHVGSTIHVSPFEPNFMATTAGAP
jgi:Protein of unknown function (DUF4232)